MKKIIIATAFILATGIFASCDKATSIQNSSTFIVKGFSDRKDLGSGD